MADSELAGFLARHVQSVPYHEVGHMVAAVLQELPLQERGLHIDTEGSGVSYYCHRLPGDPANSKKDRVERRRSVIALFAAWAAQQKAFPDCADGDNRESDRDTANALLAELQPTDSKARRAVEADLREQARRLVSENWAIIEGLVTTLSAKPVTPLPSTEVAAGWSSGQKRMQKFMSGSEVAEYFKEFGIAAHIWQG